MRQSITDRYDKDADGRVIIDVTAASMKDLYDRFDSTANYNKKDLDLKFAEYLIQSVNEIKRHPFLIRINLEHPETPENMERVRGSVRHYFEYQQERQRHEINKHLGRFCYFLGLGITLVFISLFLRSRYGAAGNIFTDLGIEGLTIVAWVSMWEGVSNLIFEWVPHFQRYRQYGRIANGPVHFRQPTQP
ncbi:MAG: hypothetical protein OEV73_02155 [Desulfobulbaceae bacterium]|nr:hypothetical protein [Desulfobulbaceae bacterium]